MSSSISPKIFKERYFCFYSSTTQNDNKLIFAKVQKLNNIFTKKTDEELSKTHTKIHTDYNSMYISSPIEQQYTNSSNNIKNDKTDIYKEKIDDFLKENHLDDYMISYILINQYNIKMKILLSTQSKCIKEGNLLFNNKKLHKILIKLKDRSINSKSNFINTLFTEDECKYVYHFMNFYYRYVDTNILYNLNTNFEGKTDEEITILKKENHLKMNYNNKIEILDLRTLSPLDEEMIFETVKRHGKVLLLTEEPSSASFTLGLAGLIQKNCFEFLDAPVEIIGSENTPAIPLNKTLEATLLPNAEKVEKAISTLFKY